MRALVLLVLALSSCALVDAATGDAVCDPFKDGECDDGAICVLDPDSGDGTCQPPYGYGTQGAPCTVMFDELGNYGSDNCEYNYLCAGVTPQAPNGTCARVCKAGDASTCNALGIATCTASNDRYGLCL